MSIILPDTASGQPAPQALLKAHEWKVVWSHEPRRMAFIHVTEPKPAWADLEWEPPYGPLCEDVGMRTVLRVFIAEGWDADYVDETMGQSLRSWSLDPSRVARYGDKSQLMASFDSLLSHLKDGGRLRDVPIGVCELVFDKFGAETFRFWLQAEYEQFGLFPAPYGDLVNDLWTQAPGDQLKRIDTSPHLERTAEVH